MITSTLFGNPRTGQRLGNQLFQLASLLGMAKHFGTQLSLPPNWKDRHFFVDAGAVNWSAVLPTKVVEEPSFTCCLPYFESFEREMQNECVDVKGFLQSPHYWETNEDLVHQVLRFRPFVSEMAAEWISDQRIDLSNTVAISVRRGDFLTDPNHYLLPQSFYAEAYARHFEGMPICFFSDDLNWCMEHLGRLNKHCHFATGLTGILQLAVMRCFSHFIIANSTFSWWGAYLSENNQKTIRPFHHFDGSMKLTDISDHYPMDWVSM